MGPDTSDPSSSAAVVAGFVCATALVAVGLYALRPPAGDDRLLSLRVADIRGADREWTEVELSAVRRRLETGCVRGLARRRGPGQWQVVAGAGLSVTLGPSAASTEAGGETVFFSPATPPRIAAPAPVPAAVPGPPPPRPGFRAHAASTVALGAVATVRRFPTFDAAAAAAPPPRFIVVGAPPSDPAFYAVVTAASPGDPVVADPASGTTVYERVGDPAAPP